MGFTFDVNSLDGQWRSIIHDFTGFTVPTKPNKPCPFCGGDDRFSYTNKHNNGTWLCRQCTPNGSDGIGFIARKLNRDRKNIFKELATRYAYDQPPRDIVEVKFESEFVLVEPKAVWDKHTLFNKEKHYNFQYVWNWFNHHGDHFAYVARMEFFSKEKNEDVKVVWQIHHGYFKDQPERIGWYQVAIQPKPLFGYHPAWWRNDMVVICEGEKTCVALWKLLRAIDIKATVLCTQGGASQIDCTDWDALRGRENIYIWPDNDEAGFNYANKIKKILPCAKAFSRKEIIELGLQEKQDAADLETLSITQFEELINHAE